MIDTLAMLYLESDRVKRAISLLEEACKAEPGLPELQLHLARAYREDGRADDARQLLVTLQRGTWESDALRPRIEEALDSLP